MLDLNFFVDRYYLGYFMIAIQLYFCYSCYLLLGPTVYEYFYRVIQGWDVVINMVKTVITEVL